MSNSHTPLAGMNFVQFKGSNSIYSVIFSLTTVDYSSKQPDIHETILSSKSCAKVV